MSIQIVSDRKIHVFDIHEKIARKVIAGCRKCDKFTEFKRNTENPFPYMDWIICSSFGKQRVKTCSTCIRNKNNVISKKDIQKTMRVRNGIYKKPDVIAKQKLKHNLY